MAAHIWGLYNSMLTWYDKTWKGEMDVYGLQKVI